MPIGTVDTRPPYNAAQDANRFPTLLGISGTAGTADTTGTAEIIKVGVNPATGALYVQDLSGATGTTNVSVLNGTINRVSNVGTLELGSVTFSGTSSTRIIDGTVTNVGTVPGVGTVTNLGSVTNIGSIAAGILTSVTSVGSVVGVGTITNLGSITNIGSIAAGVLTSVGTVPGIGTISNIVTTSGTVTGVGTVTNLGSITNVGSIAAGNLTSSGTTTGVGTITNLGSVTNVGSIAAGILTSMTTLSNLTNGSINILTGTLQSAGTTTGVGVVSNLTNGSVNLLTGTVTSVTNLAGGTVQINPTPVPTTLTFGTLGTAGGSFFATISAASGAGTKHYVTGLSIVQASGTADVRILSGTAIQGSQVLAAGFFSPSGGMVREFNPPLVTGTNSELTYHFVGAGTAFIIVNYWKGA